MWKGRRKRKKEEKRNSITTPDCNSDCKYFGGGYIEIMSKTEVSGKGDFSVNPLYLGRFPA